MAERRVEVLAVAADGVRVRLLGGACDGCLGCGGRCGLFAADVDGELTVSPPASCVHRGQRLRLSIDDRRLRVAAWRGYGVAWLGMLLGAAVGRALAVFAPPHADALTLAGLVSGTFLAVAISKRHRADPQLLADGDAPSSLPYNETTPP